MDAWIDPNRLPDLAALCRRFRVRRLELFGSAAAGSFDINQSDVDLLVEFEEMAPQEYVDSYFGLLEELEGVLGRSVDLVSADAIVNPYFRRSVDSSRRLLYAA